MIDFEQAQRQAIELARALDLGAETCALENAVHRVLSATLRANEDLVPFARSAMDGFAVRAADVGTGATLPVRGEVFAELGSREHQHGTATAIATGGALPAGADTVVKVEDVVRHNGSVRIAGPVYAGKHVFPAGDDAHAGDSLVERGTRLRAAMLGLLGAAGHARVDVFKRPRVALLSTGNELVALETQPGIGQIRDSNGPLFAATLRELGAHVVQHEHVNDERELLERALARALDACDLLVTCGGASVGERDLVKPVLRGLGVEFAFEEVALRPAKPTAFGKRSATLVAVLPGNPAAAFVALHEIVRPVVATLCKVAGEPRLPRVTARLAGAMHGRPARTYAAFAALRLTGTGLEATPLDNQCSSLTRSLAEADGFIVVPHGAGDLMPGAPVTVDVLDWSRVAAR